LVMALIMVPACASPPVPTEPTVESLRTSYRQLSEMVRAGQITPQQAREKYYQKLNDVAPNLPGLTALIAFRQKVAEEVAVGQLTAEEAHARLTARESDLLDRWEKMAAEYAAEQRRVEEQHNQYEQGYDRQIRIEQGSGIRNLPPNTPR
jgi:C4-dicarboxylate-specific signal transduction histidine kinase